MIILFAGVYPIDLLENKDLMKYESELEKPDSKIIQSLILSVFPHKRLIFFNLCLV
jgi:hypothetical protein